MVAHHPVSLTQPPVRNYSGVFIVMYVVSDFIGQLSSKVGESSKIPDMSGFPRPSLVSGRSEAEIRLRTWQK